MQPHTFLISTLDTVLLSVSLSIHFTLAKEQEIPMRTGSTGSRARLAFWKGGRYLCRAADRNPILGLSLCSLIVLIGANSTRCHFVRDGNVVNSKLMSIRCYYHRHHHQHHRLLRIGSSRTFQIPFTLCFDFQRNILRITPLVILRSKITQQHSFWIQTNMTA